MNGVITGFAVVAAIIAVGWTLRRTNVLADDGYLTLNRVSFYAATPALLFTVMIRTDLSEILSAHMAVAIIAFFGAAVLYVLIALILRRRGFGRTVVGAVSSGFANNNNIGLPITLFVLGDVRYAAIVLLMQTVLVTPGFLATLIFASGGRPTIRSVGGSIARNPIILASTGGLLVASAGVTLPDALLAPLDMTAAAAIPLVLMAFGASLPGSRPLGRGSPVAEVVTAALIKCIGMPLFALAAATALFGMSGKALLAAVLVAALPTGQMVFSYTARYGVAVALARDTVLVTTALCVPVMITITAMIPS